MVRNKSAKATVAARLRQGFGGQAACEREMTVAVALSGGVDSSVAAALLKKQGYKVVGFFMKNWSDKFGLKEADCPWHQDRQDAMAAAAKLDIPFHTLDFEEEYKNQVLDYFFSEYSSGRTPNPDVMCNTTIKFGVFLDKVLELGADLIATGHYARLRRETSIINNQSPTNNQFPITNFQLLKSVDKNKDQTYFLYRLTQEQLSRVMFPVGEYTKPEVRAMAKKFGLPNHAKRDSQGVCFIGHIDLRRFLSQKIKDKPGDIITADGKIVGKHRGLFWYTIGQRKGIEIGGIGPFYVVAKDLKNNQLIVTHNPKDELLYKSVVEFNDANWIGQGGGGMACQGRIRYREPLIECRVEKMDSRWSLSSRSKGGNDGPTYRATFTEPLRAVASGQSIVLYDGEVCLGGGVIM